MKRALACAAALVACGASVACSSGGDDTTTDAASDVSEASAADDADAGPPTIDVPAAVGTWTVSEDVTFAGKGAGDLGTIAITHGTGTLEFHGETAQAFFFVSTSTPTGQGDGGQFAGERDFEVVAASPDRYVLAWITCANGTDLAYIYYESTDGLASTAETAASGTCTIVEQSNTESVSLPAATFPPPAVVSGFTITGSQIAFDGENPGTAKVAGTETTLYPFHVIDCTTCANPGWYELHSLFWDPSAPTASFGILYLQQASPSSVELAYFIRLPALDDPIGTSYSYAATWTTP